MISAVILTKNEEKNIKDCLESVNFCNEILVIDDCSTDKTKEIAKKAGAKVIEKNLDGDFSSQRNFGLQKAENEWILFLDADERISSELKAEILSALKNNSEIKGYFFKRNDFFINKWLKYGETANVSILRLGQKNFGTWKRKVDEVWDIEGETDCFDNPLLHYSHLNLDSFLKSINERSSLNAKEFFEQGIKNNHLDWFKPLGKFIYNYFLNFGFLDGVNGFVFAVLMSFHSFLVRGKLYLLWEKQKKEIL
jgi:glycosyltransferase involved in cell wall biosynthesis